MNVAKIEYFLGNIKGYENQQETSKKWNSKKAYNYLRVWIKMHMGAQDKKGKLQRWWKSLSFFDGFDGNNETYMRTTNRDLQLINSPS